MATQITKESKEHYAAHGELRLHAQGIKTTFDGGACLYGHCNPGYNKAKNVSCMYRWQAHEHGKAEKRLTNRYERWPLGVTGRVKTSAWLKGRKRTPTRVGASIPAPTDADDWALAGPTRATYKDALGRRITPGANFRDQDTWPYWHNSHHMIPNGLFTDELDAAVYTKQIRRTLLAHPYNINFKRNVVILPQDEEVARLLSFPRHLLQKTRGVRKALGATDTFDHPKYTRAVQDRLTKIIGDYDNEWRNILTPPSTCMVVSATTTVDRLDKLSDDCLTKILAVGKTHAGLATDDTIDNIPDYA